MHFAHRCGFWWVKGELEECLFRLLQPERYRMIRSTVGSRRKNREAIRTIAALLRPALETHHIGAWITGRPKRISSIHRKLELTNVALDEIYDVRALRIIVADIPACYAALNLIHRIYSPIAGELDDYIAHPKINGYRSLHTAVLDQAGHPCEIQIRTAEMHRTAEMGTAAHWRYKESTYSPIGFDILSLDADLATPISLDIVVKEPEEAIR